MDYLWKREIARSKLLGQPPRRVNRIILEGTSDKKIFDKFSNSNLYNVQCLDSRVHGYNKHEVVKVVSESLDCSETPLTMGLVDMDGDIDGKLLSKHIHRYNNEILPNHVKDSRNEACVFSLISRLIDKNWNWLGELASNQLLPHDWNDWWKVVLKISKFRTHLLMYKQRNETPPARFPSWAIRMAKITSRDHGFEEWLDLFLNNKNLQIEHVNDHCLESTVTDFILFRTKNLHPSIDNLIYQVRNALSDALIAKIKQTKFSLDSVLAHTGHPFESD